MNNKLGECFQASGVMAIWTGNENALFIGNLAIVIDDAPRLTRGEEWTVSTDLAQDDFLDQPGYVPFNSPSLADTFVHEGDVAWLTGANFAKNYENYLEFGGPDILGFKLWHRFPDGCAMNIGSARSFYELSGRFARAAMTFYEGRVGRGADPTEPHIQAARSLYEGSPGVARVERRIADAFWYHVTENYEMYSRTEAQAERFDDIPVRALKEEVHKKIEFYSEPRMRNQSARLMRALIEENAQLRALAARGLELRVAGQRLVGLPLPAETYTWQSDWLAEGIRSDFSDALKVIYETMSTRKRGVILGASEIVDIEVEVSDLARDVDD
jgi:hypothetical protein